MKKQMIVGLLCATLTLSACSVDSKPNTTSAGNSATQTDLPATSSGNLQKAGIPILNTPETFKVVVQKSPLNMNTFPEKEIVGITEKATNIVINWVEIPSSGFVEKTNIMFASGDLPDAFLGGISTGVIAKNTAVLAPLGDIIDEYAPTTKKLLEDRADIKTALTNMDGKIYSLPINAEIAADLIPGNMWVSKKWLDNVSLSVPTTQQEFYAMLKAFKEKDANGNGNPNDEIPFSSSQSNPSAGLGIDGLLGVYGVLDNPEHVMVKDGKVFFTAASESYHEGLKWLSQLFKEGLFDTEIFTQNEEQFSSKFKGSDTVGCFTSFGPDTVVGGERLDEFVCILPLKGDNGSQLWPRAQPLNLGGFVMTKSCKEPAALLRMYDYISSDLSLTLEWAYGKEGNHWEWVDKVGGEWRVMIENLPSNTPYGEWRQTLSAGPVAPCFMPTLWSSDLKVLTAPRDILKLATVNAYLPFTAKPSELPPIGFDDPARSDKKTLLAVEIDNYVKKFKADSVMNGITDADWQKHTSAQTLLKVEEYVGLVQQFYDLQKQ